MKKPIGLLMFIFLLLSLIVPSTVIANGISEDYALIGREIWPGIEYDGIFKGAIFIGKVYSGLNPVGYFTVTIDRVGNGVEECGEQTGIIRFKLSMSLSGIGRIVLNKVSENATADWYWDDPNCPDGGQCWDDQVPTSLGELGECENYGPEGFIDDGDYGYPDSVSLVAAVNPIILRKQWFGTYGAFFRSIRYGVIQGLLIHTPPVFPAVIGYVSLSENLPVLP